MIHVYKPLRVGELLTTPAKIIRIPIIATGGGEILEDVVQNHVVLGNLLRKIAEHLVDQGHAHTLTMHSVLGKH